MSTASRAADRHPWKVPAWAGWVVAALVFAATAPTLGWLEFSNGIEQLHAATVLEIRRTGNWIIPTLNGRERIRKPPLPAWLSAAAVSDSAMRGASSNDPSERATAYADLAWQTRWPIALCGCLMLAAVFDLGTTLGRSRRVGLAAAVIAGTSALFLRYARLGSTDVPLALFVAAANALLARAAIRGQVRRGIGGAGLAIGLGFMCKGPIVLLQTAVPLAIWWLLVRRTPASGRTPRGGGRAVAVWSAVAVAAFLAMTVPWPLLVLRQQPEAMKTWLAEIFREGATDHEYGPVWSYLSLLPYMLPWLPFFVVGLAASVRSRKRSARRRGVPPVARGFAYHRGYLLATLWLLVPIAVMSIARDKHERYLLPMLPAAAVLSARGLLACVAWAKRRRPSAGQTLGATFVLVAAAAVVVPTGLLAASVSPTLAAKLDLQIPLAASVVLFAVGLAVGVAQFVRVRRGQFWHATAASAVILLGLNAVLLAAYADSVGGRSEMRPIAEQIRRRRPDVVVGYFDPRRSPKPMPPDLSIYLNRVVENVGPADGFLSRRQNRPAEVLVVLQREEEDQPIVPAGWKLMASEPYGRRFWHALERRP